MDSFNYELKQLCRHNRDGSFATQADRERLLDLIANQLKDMGYRHMHATSIKSKHVDALVNRWHTESIAPGTFKNRMTALRWACEKTGKIALIERSNDIYRIPRRAYVSNVSKAWTLDEAKLAAITDPYTTMSLRLQEAFGLRREESIKIEPASADQGDRIVLKASWTKGGRSREIPIRSTAQRTLLDQAKLLAGRGSLIPGNLRYIEQRNRFKAQCQRAGIRNVHGLRHHYAQTWYREFMGFACPAQGGPRRSDLNAEQRTVDKSARLTISAELGHGRLSVLAVYLGR
jgi:integrase